MYREEKQLYSSSGYIQFVNEDASTVLALRLVYRLPDVLITVNIVSKMWANLKLV